MRSVLILVSLVGAFIFAGLSRRRDTAVLRALQPSLPMDLRGVRLMRLGNWVWNPLVPAQAKWDYLICVIYGCAGGALLTLALVVGGWVGPALLTGIATASGIIQAIVSSVKYREAAAHAAGAHDPGR